MGGTSSIIRKPAESPISNIVLMGRKGRTAVYAAVSPERRQLVPETARVVDNVR